MPLSTTADGQTRYRSRIQAIKIPFDMLKGKQDGSARTFLKAG